MRFNPLKFDSLHEDALNRYLKHLGFTLDKPAEIAAEIVKLSDCYNSGRGSPEIWNHKGFIAAYLTYFHPLNSVRLHYIMQETERRRFWRDIENVIDFGSGMGTLHLTLLQRSAVDSIQKVLEVEANPEARNWAQVLLDEISTPLNWRHERASHLPAHISPKTVMCFSYSLNELPRLPEAAYDSEGLLFIEPSTSAAGRRLQELRQALIDRQYHVWAPCLHQLRCPLLVHSKRDWCHTRVHIVMPDWFRRLEQHLPMKNDTVTFSYLLARKTSPSETYSGAWRVVGDTLYEKGKVRQAVCASDAREFFSWLKKDGEAPVLPRGSIVKVQSPLIKKSDELRPSEGDFKFEFI